MSRWLVGIDGDPGDLEQYPTWFPDGPIFAIREDGHVYLTGASFDQLSTADEVHAKAAETLREFGAVLSVLDPHSKISKAGGVIRENDDGSRHFTMFAEAGHYHIRGHAAAVFVSGAGEQPQHRETEAQRLLDQARRNPHLLVAASIWAEPPRSWPRLHRIMEEIEGYLGKPLDKAAYCSRKERERFARTANSAEASGNNARHRAGMFEPPPNPMSLRDGTFFIHRVLQRALGN
jgi:hypothetical protein